MQNNPESAILKNELLLCDKMLKQDERNFHCWNYRYWVVDVYLKEIHQRVLLNDPEAKDVWNTH